ncbi:hypothetical protein KQX54_006073 [Cotesia glomerata]|uniref:Uncharacterized protein n=1 Tax=Cotesia glomerata TaxID=32391 RepID=A0AAV7ID90_COTGL|nr:hypothetical protein KQX54_006073 [Cotesia glomerata]
MMKSLLSLIPSSDKKSDKEPKNFNEKVNENLLFVLVSLVGLCLLRVDFIVILIIVILMYMLYINGVALATSFVMNSSYAFLFGGEDEDENNDENSDNENDISASEFYEKFHAKVELMKNARIDGTSVTFYDVLHKSKQKLIGDLQNVGENVGVTEPELREKFPLYGGWICYRLEYESKKNLGGNSDDQ